MLRPARLSFFFFFNDTATTEIYTLSLHDALPILLGAERAAAVGIAHVREALAIGRLQRQCIFGVGRCIRAVASALQLLRSEEHTSELQSLAYLVCRLLLEKKNSHQHHYSHPLATR